MKLKILAILFVLLSIQLTMRWIVGNSYTTIKTSCCPSDWRFVYEDEVLIEGKDYRCVCPYDETYSEIWLKADLYIGQTNQFYIYYLGDYDDIRFVD